MKRDLLSVSDIEPAEVQLVLDRAAHFKADRRSPDQAAWLAGRTAALLFELPSLRTTVSFQIAIQELGGTALVLRPDEVQLGVRESVADVARVLSRYVDLIVARVRTHESLEELARWASVPVINALSDREHPCQAFADFLTLQERFGALAGRHLAYFGDPNNVANSLILLAARTGVRLTLVGPSDLPPDPTILAAAREAGGDIRVETNPRFDLAQVDAVYTDVWTSMAQSDPAGERPKKFAPYQINEDLVARLPEHAIVLHCLPAKRGQEITDGVLDGSRSAVFDQAENRLHAQKALLVQLLS